MSAQQKLSPDQLLSPKHGPPFEKKLVVDLFAGSGGASTGIADGP
jgi:DNA (cytosine-5)-methyltransferase 1